MADLASTYCGKYAVPFVWATLYTTGIQVDEVCGPGQTMLKYKPHFGQIRPLHHDSQPMNFSAHPRYSTYWTGENEEILGNQ